MELTTFAIFWAMNSSVFGTDSKVAPPRCGAMKLRIYEAGPHKFNRSLAARGTSRRKYFFTPFQVA